MASVQILIWLSGFNFSQSCAFFLCSYLLIFSGIHKEMQTLFSLSHKNRLCWEGQGESKGGIWEFLAPQFSLPQLICDSENQHSCGWHIRRWNIWLPAWNINTAGPVHTDTSCVRISDHNPYTREERKATLGKSISSFSSFLILLRRWNERIYFSS